MHRHEATMFINAIRNLIHEAGQTKNPIARALLRHRIRKLTTTLLQENPTVRGELRRLQERYKLP